VIRRWRFDVVLIKIEEFGCCINRRIAFCTSFITDAYTTSESRGDLRMTQNHEAHEIPRSLKTRIAVGVPRAGGLAPHSA